MVFLYEKNGLIYTHMGERIIYPEFVKHTDTEFYPCARTIKQQDRNGMQGYLETRLMIIGCIPVIKTIQSEKYFFDIKCIDIIAIIFVNFEFGNIACMTILAYLLT